MFVHTIYVVGVYSMVVPYATSKVINLMANWKWMVLKFIFADSLWDTWVVASVWAIKLYGFEILMDKIQMCMKDSCNMISFLVITWSNKDHLVHETCFELFFVVIFVLNFLLVFLIRLKEEFQRFLAHLVLLRLMN